MAKDLRFGDLPDDVASEQMERRADLVAAARVHSHVSSEVFAVVRGIADDELARAKVVQTEQIAARIVFELPTARLAEIVADWLETQAIP